MMARWHRSCVDDERCQDWYTFGGREFQIIGVEMLKLRAPNEVRTKMGRKEDKCLKPQENDYNDKNDNYAMMNTGKPAEENE